MTAETSRARPTPIEDKTLIGDIPPEMLAKLQLDGQLFGYMILMLALAAIPTLGFADRLAAEIAAVLSLGSDGPRRVADFALLFGIFGGCLSLPWYFKRRTVREELRYRRRYGKWRWER